MSNDNLQKLYKIAKVNEKVYTMQELSNQNNVVRVELDSARNLVVIHYFINSKAIIVPDNIYNDAMELANEVFSGKIYRKAD